MPIRPIHFICRTNKTHKWMMCHAPYSAQKVKDQGHMGCRNFCHINSMAPCLFDQIASHGAQIQPMRWQCVMHHFQVKMLKVKVTCICHVCSVAISFLSLKVRGCRKWPWWDTESTGWTHHHAWVGLVCGWPWLLVQTMVNFHSITVSKVLHIGFWDWPLFRSLIDIYGRTVQQSRLL